MECPSVELFEISLVMGEGGEGAILFEGLIAGREGAHGEIAHESQCIFDNL